MCRFYHKVKVAFLDLLWDNTIMPESIRESLMKLSQYVQKGRKADEAARLRGRNRARQILGSSIAFSLLLVISSFDVPHPERFISPIFISETALTPEIAMTPTPSSTCMTVGDRVFLLKPGKYPADPNSWTEPGLGLNCVS
ncbi:hypothetical protein A3C26_01505 [Candidatus Daviesbacteria bacterium RIFCSPHIGHO2_02_FULL_39_12]|uniref:Uncharacterized protein n=2 Tax=Candidatus Daviesiibacteriota TaxID=1752718 RepID=A0A1F5JCR7_9BACT|nr:MAG: hypothetical protein A3C26_01505 [Candidatus Daviesbacteria bacterium RIFCSPHIGHO2_02_FULL_39_12]OGE72854.1 MAG: hypothetical protein A3H40_01745 [Candidatus Daviesbacteria bacterium RIFCSPLOWO2_02_FULL_38_15]